MISGRNDIGKVTWLAVVVLSAVMVWLPGCGGQGVQSDGPTGAGGSGDRTSGSIAEKYAGTWVDATDPDNHEAWNTVVLEVSGGRIALIDAGKTEFAIENGRMSYSYSNETWDNTDDGKNHDFIVTMTQDKNFTPAARDRDGFRGRWVPIGLPAGLSDWEVTVPEVVIDMVDAADGRLEIVDSPGGSSSFWLFDGDTLVTDAGSSNEKVFARQ